MVVGWTRLMVANLQWLWGWFDEGEMTVGEKKFCASSQRNCGNSLVTFAMGEDNFV